MHTTALDTTTLEACVSAAVAAPSIHNTQPWRYRLDPEAVTFRVRAAPERGLRHTDPTGRALHVSVGASVLNLRIAAARFGWYPVTRLLPSPDDPGLLATVRLTGTAARPNAHAGHRADLYAAIERRHSSRFPFSARPLPSLIRAELIEAAHAEGALLVLPTPDETARLLRLTAEAEHRNRTDPDRAAESRRWVRPDPYEPSDVGLPPTALGPQDSHERLALRDFTAQRYPERLPSMPFEPEPVIALLTTEHDRRADWLRAGQALEHVLLVAAAHGLRTSLLHQPMEWPDLRRSLSRAPAQMLIRLGYGPDGPATPRRAAHKLFATGRPDQPGG
jgi:nitroreductase